MKKIFSLILAVFSLLSLAACSKSAVEMPGKEFCQECSKEELMALFDDPDITVRAEAAAACGGFDDLEFLPKLEEILMAPDVQNIHASALKSLEMLWYDAPRYEKIHGEAYELFMEYLQHEPGAPLPNVEAFKVFYQKLEDKWIINAVWFSKDELISALENILEDPACEGDYREAVQRAADVLKATQTSLPGACNLTW